MDSVGRRREESLLPSLYPFPFMNVFLVEELCFPGCGKMFGSLSIVNLLGMYWPASEINKQNPRN